MCGKTMDNDRNSIMYHLKSLRHQLAESVQATVAQVMVGEHLAFGGNAHRKATVDSYMLAYFCMRDARENSIHTACEDERDYVAPSLLRPNFGEGGFSHVRRSY